MTLNVPNPSFKSKIQMMA